MIYSSKCGDCSTVFERVVRLADMNVPLDQPCPECGVEGRISRHIDGATPIGDASKLNPYKAMGGFREVLHKVKNSHYKSNLQF